MDQTLLLSDEVFAELLAVYLISNETLSKQLNIEGVFPTNSSFILTSLQWGRRIHSLVVISRLVKSLRTRSMARVGHKKNCGSEKSRAYND